MWHAVAPWLAEQFTVVAADLPGYGGSFRPAGTADHRGYAKRALAGHLVAAMAVLGRDATAVAGHDRGGRVAYRVALDHPEVVTRAPSSMSPLRPAACRLRGIGAADLRRPPARRVITGLYVRVVLSGGTLQGNGAKSCSAARGPGRSGNRSASVQAAVGHSRGSDALQ